GSWTILQRVLRLVNGGRSCSRVSRVCSRLLRQGRAVDVWLRRIGLSSSLLFWQRGIGLGWRVNVVVGWMWQQLWRRRVEYEIRSPRNGGRSIGQWSANGRGWKEWCEGGHRAASILLQEDHGQVRLIFRVNGSICSSRWRAGKTTENGINSCI